MVPYNFLWLRALYHCSKEVQHYTPPSPSIFLQIEDIHAPPSLDLRGWKFYLLSRSFFITGTFVQISSFSSEFYLFFPKLAASPLNTRRVFFDFPPPSLLYPKGDERHDLHHPCFFFPLFRRLNSTVLDSSFPPLLLYVGGKIDFFLTVDLWFGCRTLLYNKDVFLFLLLVLPVGKRIPSLPVL